MTSIKGSWGLVGLGWVRSRLDPAAQPHCGWRCAMSAPPSPLRKPPCWPCPQRSSQCLVHRIKVFHSFWSHLDSKLRSIFVCALIETGYMQWLDWIRRIMIKGKGYDQIDGWGVFCNFWSHADSELRYVLVYALVVMSSYVIERMIKMMVACAMSKKQLRVFSNPWWSVSKELKRSTHAKIEGTENKRISRSWCGRKLWFGWWRIAFSHQRYESGHWFMVFRLWLYIS